MWISIATIGILGVPLVLIWWRDMDRWANAEDKRFKPKPKPEHPQERVVVKLGNSSSLAAYPATPQSSSGPLQPSSVSPPGIGL